MEERIQKLLSGAGICSRRMAESYLSAGRITVNGMIAVLGQRADPDRDDIRVDGKRLPSGGRWVYLLLNKPRGVVTTLKDEKGRRTVADLVATCGKRVYPVGRLDLDSEGLVLMTNDGPLAQRLTHPRYRMDKIYLATVSGKLEGAATRLSSLTQLDGEKICPAQVEVLRRNDREAELRIVIHEGKNRQIRRMCGACGLTVRRLRRIQEHTLALGDLPPGKWRYLTDDEIAALKRV